MVQRAVDKCSMNEGKAESVSPLICCTKTTGKVAIKWFVTCRPKGGLGHKGFGPQGLRRCKVYVMGPLKKCDGPMSISRCEDPISPLPFFPFSILFLSQLSSQLTVLFCLSSYVVIAIPCVVLNALYQVIFLSM